MNSFSSLLFSPLVCGSLARQSSSSQYTCPDTSSSVLLLVRPSCLIARRRSHTFVPVRTHQDQIFRTTLSSRCPVFARTKIPTRSRPSMRAPESECMTSGSKISSRSETIVVKMSFGRAALHRTPAHSRWRRGFLHLAVRGKHPRHRPTRSVPVRVDCR